MKKFFEKVAQTVRGGGKAENSTDAPPTAPASAALTTPDSSNASSATAAQTSKAQTPVAEAKSVKNAEQVKAQSNEKPAKGPTSGTTPTTAAKPTAEAESKSASVAPDASKSTSKLKKMFTVKKRPADGQAMVAEWEQSVLILFDHTAILKPMQEQFATAHEAPAKRIASAPLPNLSKLSERMSVTLSSKSTDTAKSITNKVGKLDENTAAILQQRAAAESSRKNRREASAADYERRKAELLNETEKKREQIEATHQTQMAGLRAHYAPPVAAT